MVSKKLMIANIFEMTYFYCVRSSTPFIYRLYSVFLILIFESQHFHYH
jgi:hypothetical protein